jgi:DNA-binding response OmpR family regulator
MLVEEILMVNDGSPLLKKMGSLLEHKGHQLSLTDSPEDALVLLSTRNIVLAVIKLNGQQPDRLALLHRVKELDAGTKLIIMSDQERLPAEAFEVDADDYLILPCRPAEIWRRLTSYQEAPVPQTAVSSEAQSTPCFMFPDMQGHKAAEPQNRWLV